MLIDQAKAYAIQLIKRANDMEFYNHEYTDLWKKAEVINGLISWLELAVFPGTPADRIIIENKLNCLVCTTIDLSI